MYDDISNLKDKFQEDAFSFQDFSSNAVENVVSLNKVSITNKEENKKNSAVDTVPSTEISANLSNEAFLETSHNVKNEPKQPITQSIPSSHQDALANKAKKENIIKNKPVALPDNSIFDNAKTDKNHVSENISLKDMLSFIASV